ncbi:AAA family ATPase [Sphingobacterium chuzhouense]|uniref:AAA family ATPase n=1 Tax=Sphingobacterium chuzhouense TaxID=1742264 RepID=A0ABR7XS46_9SPHI|nr:AAA family ATPase [Sphingobacterium chuzhouense]MBD1421994.1 AAA family ATPase [Sphingobacterium chuzhouense]
MKILAIRIKNLASLEGQTEIDFTSEPLCSAGIFAITGSTGAGKSTILDALCLALYGKTPRYLQAKEVGIEIHDVQGNKISQGDVRGILRDGTAEGFAEVDFVGIDGQQYRSTWSVRRARNKADGSIQADSIVLKNITSHIDIPGKKVETYKEIERLVGLNFEQFTRSVLLAQGDFTAFMRASKDEKSSLLEKLTGTHIYSEISKRIYDNYKLEEQQLRDLNFRKEGIEILTEEETQSLHEERLQLEADIKIKEKEIEYLTTEINWHEELAKLGTAQHSAHILLQQAVDAKENSRDRKQKLFHTEQAQKTRSWSDTLKHAQQQKGDKKATLTTLKESIAQLDSQKLTLDAQLATLETDLKAKNNAFNDAAPLLAEARRLDTLLLEKRDQLVKAKEDADVASLKSSEQEKAVEDKQAALTKLLLEIEKLEAWKVENIDRRPIAENREIILSKLQDAHKLLEALQSAVDELAGLQQKITKGETEKGELETLLRKHRQGWDDLKKQYDAQSSALSLVAIESLSKEKEETDRAVEDIIQAQASWQLLYKEMEDYERLTRKQLKDQADYEAKKERLQALSQQLASENVQKEISAQLLQKARLAASENVEALRATLVDHEPCPVCGSEDHPYALHNPQLDNVLATLEATHLENEQTYLHTYRRHNALEQECQSLQLTMQGQSEEITTKKSALDGLIHQWESSTVGKESLGISDATKAQWIDEKIESLRTTQSNLHAQAQAYHAQKGELEFVKAKLDQLKESIDGCNGQLKDKVSALALYQEQRQNQTIKRETARLAICDVEELLSPHFNFPDWMENWKKAPAPFLDRINTFATRWKDSTDKLEENNRQHAILVATLQELESQAKKLISDSSDKRAVHTLQYKNYKELEIQRQAIFRGQSAEDIEVQLKQALTEAQQQLEDLKKVRQQLSIDITRAITQQEELIATIEVLETDTTAAIKKMQNWLDSYNLQHSLTLTMDMLHELLSLPSDWIDRERAALQIIEEEVMKGRSIFNERTHQLETHKQKSLSERPLDELNALIVATRTDAEQNKQTRGEIAFKLQQDKSNKERIGELLKSIAVQTNISERWGKLNEIIGSADGKKFRQIAQEYTLDVLLGYANIHLQVLTNRYKIERIPTTLGLQVVDQDMGDEVRTVYSLSGGESFLVSLALALGLASLSSSRMKVESLFIDEGFGSLDPTTLNIAMDALERLHNQGRKVGVISHVQEMTERIPVQIMVSKQQSGKSKVELTSV